MRNLMGLFKSFYARKLLRYFLVLFLIPFTVITLLILNGLFSSFSQQASQEQLRETVKAMDHLQAWPKTFERIVTQLVGDNTLSRNRLMLYSEQHRLQEKLRLLTAAHGGLECIWYQLPDDRGMISGDDALSIDRLNDARFLPLEEQSQRTIYERLQAGEILPLYDRYKGRECLLYPCFILSADRRNPQKTLIVFELNLRSIASELEGLLGAAQGTIRLRDASGKALIQYSASYSGAFERTALCEQGSAEQYMVTSGCEGSLLAKRHLLFSSVATDQWAIDLISISNLLRRFQVMQSVALLMMVVLMFGCAVCIVLFMRMYKPIRSIRASIENAAMLTDADIDDDYNYIESSIEQISGDNRQLRLMLNAHTEKARGYVASMLFSGRIKNVEEFRAVYGFCGFTPADEHFYILAVDTNYMPYEQILSVLHLQDSIHFTQINQQCYTLFYGSDTAPLFSELEKGLGVSDQGKSFARLPVHCAQAWFAVTMHERSFSSDLCKQAIELADGYDNFFANAILDKEISVLKDIGAKIPSDQLYHHTCALAASILQYMDALQDVTLDDPSVFYIKENASTAELKGALGLLLALLQIFSIEKR